MDAINKKPRLRKVSSWISDAEIEIKNEDEVIANRLIVGKVIKYMEDNRMTQKQLAEKLGVSPQYINKFLHGQDRDIKISTVIRYGKLLNVKLIEIPEDVQTITYTKMHFGNMVRFRLERSQNMPAYQRTQYFDCCELTPCFR